MYSLNLDSSTFENATCHEKVFEDNRSTCNDPFVHMGGFVCTLHSFFSKCFFLYSN